MTRHRATLQLLGHLAGLRGSSGATAPTGCAWRNFSGASGSPAGGPATPSAAPAPAAPLLPGAVFSATKRFSPSEVAAFVDHTGDSNPIHVDVRAAERQGLPAPILPGMLMASLFPAIIGSNFPGAVYLSQTLKFKHYALVGDSLTATVTVERSSGSRVTFLTLCRSADSGQVVVEGAALALIKPLTPAPPPSQQ